MDTNANHSLPITLDTPIPRGDQTITEVSLRKPTAGELRGLSLLDLIRMDTGALIELLPRITAPSLSKQDVMTLDPADLMQLGAVVAAFFMPTPALADALHQANA